MRKLIILFISILLVACGGQTKEELLQEGNKLRDEGNYRGAIVLYKNALEKDANFLSARNELAETYLQSGNLDKAEKEFQKILHQNPAAAHILLKLATVFVQQRKPEAALLELDKYHSSNPESSESLNIYGRAHAASGDLESAEQLFLKALILDPEAIKPRINLAKVYLQRDDLLTAKQYLEEVLTLDKADIDANYMLANIQTREGHPDQAIETYRHLTEVKPKELFAHYMMGLLQIDMGQIDEAEKTVNKILSLFPGRPEGTRLEGFLHYRQNNYEEAILSLGESLKYQQHLLSYFFLGLSHFGLEQYELALNQFQSCLDINPEFERARILVAVTLLKQKRLDDAIIEIQKVLRANPDNAYAHNILGSAYLAQGEYDKGMAELEIATDLDATLADAHIKRGMFHLFKGEGAEGEAALIKAVDAAPEVLNSRLMLVTHYLRQKNYSAAVETLQAGLEGSASDALLYNYLAAAHFSQRKYSQAVDALNQAKSRNPDYFTPYFNLASYYESESQYDKAISEYKAVVARDDKNIRALLGLAALYGLQGNDAEVTKLYTQIEATGTEEGFVAASAYHVRLNQASEALNVITRGLAVLPDSADLLERKGRLHRQLGQTEDAEQAFVKLTGKNAERGNSLLVALYLQLKQTEKAARLIDSILKTDPQKDYPYLLSANYLISQNKADDAVNVLNKGIDSVDNSLRLEMQLASVYSSAGKMILAESIYQNILKRIPRYSPAYSALGFLKEKQGEKGQALDYYRTAVKYDQNNIVALNNTAYLLADNFGQTKEALEYAMGAYRLKPSDPRVMDTLGFVLLKNNRNKDAEKLLEKATQMLPENSAVKLHLAMAKNNLGQNSAARDLLNQVVASGTEAEVKQAEKLLNSL